MLSKLARIVTITMLLTASPLSIGAATAHTGLVSMTPAIDSVVTTAPSEVVLTFDEAVSPTGYGITVTGPDGVRIDIGPTKVAGTKLSVDLGPITLNGRYLVNYRIVSDDGHPREASAGFTVEIPELTVTSTPEVVSTPLEKSGLEESAKKPEGTSLLRNVFYLLLAGFIGGLYVYSVRKNKRRNQSTS